MEVKRVQKWATDRGAAWSGVNDGADFKHHPQSLSQGTVTHIHQDMTTLSGGGKKSLNLYQQEDVRSSLKIRGWESG